MVFLFETEKLLRQQVQEVALWHENIAYKEYDDVSMDFPKLVSMQHQVNFELWHQEDEARDPHASESKIASVKRNIDVLNQRRNDLIEKMDQFLLKILRANNVQKNYEAEMNSETPGNIVDRLSINALKIYHMDEETRRKEVDSAHRKKCEEKLSILLQQRKDLGECLIKLLDDLGKGKKILKVYHQMKMYNDENLNPVLYSKKFQNDY